MESVKDAVQTETEAGAESASESACTVESSIKTPFESGPWPPYRFWLSADHLAAFVLLPYRVLLLSLLVVGSAAVAVLHEHLLRNDDFFVWYAGWSSRLLLRRGLGFRVQVLKDDSVEPSSAPVVISNHITVYDVWALMAGLNAPLSFVARESLLRFPLISSVMRALRIVPVDRRRGQEARIKLSARLSQVDTPWPLACFPEGATTNGLGLIDFKTGIFADECSAVIPIALQYSCPSGFDLSYTSNQMTTSAVARHFIRTLLEPKKLIQVLILSPIKRSPIESNSDFALRVRSAIAQAAHLQLWSGWDAHRLRSAWYKSSAEHID